MKLMLTILVAMKCWHILRWNDLFENNKSREIETLTYYLQPNKMDGECMGQLRLEPDGWEIYGVFGYLKMLASKSEREMRGWLFRNGSPLTVERMQALTGIPTAKLQRTLDCLSTPPFDWIGYDDLPPQTPALAGQSKGTSPALAGQSKGGNSPGLRTDKGLTEGKQKEKKAASPEEAQLQRQQFAANAARRGELEAIAEDERTAEQRAELKKVRAMLRAIQKKQAAGDFSLVEGMA